LSVIALPDSKRVLWRVYSDLNFEKEKACEVSPARNKKFAKTARARPNDSVRQDALFSINIGISLGKDRADVQQVKGARQ
jgi:hypothetical protein